MPKAHKHALRSIEAVSALPVDELAAMCKQVADECKMRLEADKPGQMVFSIRSMIRPDKNRLMIFEVRLGGKGDRHVLRSRITKYKVSQTKYLGLIPLGPRRLVGLPAYDNFIKQLHVLIWRADPMAEVEVNW